MIIDFENLGSLQKEKTVYLAGVFDLIHPGHIYLFKYAKEKFPEHKLVVGVMRDDRVKALKGKLRPIMNEEERLEMVDNSRHVDYCFIYPITELEKPNWYEVPKRLSPEILLAEEGSPIDPQKLEEMGTKLTYFKKTKLMSTTEIIERIIKTEK